VLENRPESPDSASLESDPGDETARRYRYQWAWAAIVCCMLLDETLDVSEVFCEHHEDVLLKHSDGTFTGQQIKTRAPDQPVWKTGDPAIKSSCARFVSLESRFPNRFRAFHFLTNHPLHAAGNNQDFGHVLTQIRDASGPKDVTGPPLSLLREMARNMDCSEDTAFAALSKTRASSNLPKLEDIVNRLARTITPVWSRASECSYEAVFRAASRCVEECGRASSLAHADVLPAYLPAISVPGDSELAARLRGKRIDRTRMLKVLDEGVDVTEPLHSDPGDITQPGAGDTSLLRRKLSAGGFSAVSLNAAEDLRSKADYLGISWTKKHDTTRGLQRYSHVLSLVLRDAADAFEAAKSEDTSFGLEMLSQLRTRFGRRRTEGTQLYGCSDEHLEGLAFSLTSQCKAHWSLSRPWEEQ
jgi:hypothetical protein